MRPLIALISLFVAASAQAGGAECQRQAMAAVDADGDGVLTRDEASRTHGSPKSSMPSMRTRTGASPRTSLRRSARRTTAEMKTRGEERWKASDTDGDGSLSLAEATASSSWAAGRFDKLDANGDGQLTREEMSAARRNGHEQMRVHAAERFKGADANSDGGIDLAEAQTGMPWLAEKFSTADTDNDGRVTPDEIKSLRHR